MFLFVTSLICILPCMHGLSMNARSDTAHSKSSNSQDKRSLLIGDLSYSYSATDIGSKEGSHVKTITVIKNIGSPKYHKPRPHHPFDDWDTDSKNRFNFVFKFPEIPQIDSGTFFRTEKPTKVVPTKQPTDRQTPVFNTEFDTSDYDDQPNNVNVNNNDNTGPQVFEKNPEALPDPTTTVKTEISVTNEASDEVEYIQTDGEKSKSTTASPAMYHSQKVIPFRGSTSHGYRISSGKTNEPKKLQANRQKSEFVEDFSDYSMHTVKHLADPMKVKDSLLKYTQNQSNLDLKKLTDVESFAKDKTYDSYGNVVQKSQSLLDASQTYRDNSKLNAQASQRPYVSPSLKKVHNSPSQKPLAKVTTTTPSKGLVFFSTTQKPYTAPKKLKVIENSNQDKSLINPSTERIVQPMFSLQLNKDNNREQISEQMIKIEYPGQFNENYKAPAKHLVEEKKPEQQFHSYSIRNPLTTSLPIQHNHQELSKLQSYVAVPIDADLPKQHLLNNMPKRYVRHQAVFDSKPPHRFMESPFQPVKSFLMG